MTQLVLSLGSNMDRKNHLRYALDELGSLLGELKVSPVYESRAVGFSGPNFYNLAVVAQTERSIDELSLKIRSIEARAGRVRGVNSHESRSLDIDILLYGDQDLRDRGRNIPRDEIDYAAYVLKPLADVLPSHRHPVGGQRFDQMWHARKAGADELKPVEVDLS
jgi:2-amino-4-hydroxy-6-hydroxymethyldihydropteridine diphosphokinase